MRQKETVDEKTKDAALKFARRVFPQCDDNILKEVVKFFKAGAEWERKDGEGMPQKGDRAMQEMYKKGYRHGWDDSYRECTGQNK